MSMDAYTLHLLGLAVEATAMKGRDVSFTAASWIQYGGEDYEGVTLADALAALLTNLGVEVPERPAAERVWACERSARSAAPPYPTFDFLRDLYAREPLTALALLEGS